MRHSLSRYALLIILLGGFLLRLHQLTTPLADWHSFRQADTASVAREYVTHGINLLVPRYHDVSNIQSGLDNPKGYRMVEFPLLSALVAFTYPVAQTIGWELHVWFRFLNILISLGSIIILYRLVGLFGSRSLALTTALVYAILPYNVFYSRTTLPEVSLVFLSLAALYFLVKPLFQINHSGFDHSFLLGALLGAFALLTKPTAIFYLAVALYVIVRHRGIKVVLPAYVSLLLVMFIPVLFWRYWITQFPAGIPVYRWLLNSDGIRLKGAWFQWLFAERLANLILGYWGLIPFGIGFLSLDRKLPRLTSNRGGGAYRQATKRFHQLLLQLKSRFSRSDPEAPHLDRFTYLWGLSLLAYLIVFATGNVKHDYYQIILIPWVSLVIGLGITFLLKQKALTSYLLLFTSVTFMLAFSWYQIRGYYHINNWAIVKAGLAVQELTPQDALVIAPYMGDTAFLYQTNRRGWPLGFDIEDKIDKGAQYYVATSFDDETRQLMVHYQVVSQTSDFVIIKLTP